MARLESLTDEQWTDLYQYCDSVLASYYDCTPIANKSEIEAAITYWFDYVGEKAPEAFIWVDGPGSVIAAGMMLLASDNEVMRSLQAKCSKWFSLDSLLSGQSYTKFYEKLSLEVGFHTREPLWNELNHKLRYRLADQIISQLKPVLLSEIRGYLLFIYEQLGFRLLASIDQHLYQEFSSCSLSCILGSLIYEYYKISWAHYYRFINRLVCQKGSEQMEEQLNNWILANQSPAFLLSDQVCILSARQTSIHVTPDGHLHNPDGPAWSWADGTAIYALEGVRMPAWVIDGPPDARRILDELRNAEQRRVALDHIGWDVAIHDLDLTVIDAHPDPRMGTLYQLPESVGSGVANLLMVQNSSPHPNGEYQTYGLKIDRQVKTVIEAQAWLLGLSVDEYSEMGGTY